MTIGFKTGPGTFDEGRRIVEQDGASMCEVWFNVTDLDAYEDMLEWLTAYGVSMGLHHWGLVDGKYKTNLMTADEHIRSASIAQMKQTIDIGADVGAVYVNVHPGARMVEEMNFETTSQRIVPDKQGTEKEKAETLLLEAARELGEYASERDVVLTVETLPGRESNNYTKRTGVYNPQSAGLDVTERLAGQGNFIANDITHTAGQAAIGAKDEDEIWERIMKFSQVVLLQTRLVHINTVMPPHDGRDSHDGILESDFSRGVFPAKDQLIQFLQLFKGREDVFVVPEPHSNMQKNYRALAELVKNL